MYYRLLLIVLRLQPPDVFFAKSGQIEKNTKKATTTTQNTNISQVFFSNFIIINPFYNDILAVCVLRRNVCRIQNKKKKLRVGQGSPSVASYDRTAYLEESWPIRRCAPYQMVVLCTRVCAGRLFFCLVGFFPFSYGMPKTRMQNIHTLSLSLGLFTLRRRAPL